MAEVQIEILKLQPLQCLFTSFHQVFPVKSVLCWLQVISAQAEKGFAGNNITVASPVLFLENLTHHDFRLTSGIDFRVVKKVYSIIIRQRHQVISCAVSNLLTEGDPRAK